MRLVLKAPKCLPKAFAPMTRCRRSYYVGRDFLAALERNSVLKHGKVYDDEHALKDWQHFDFKVGASSCSESWCSADSHRGACAARSLAADSILGRSSNDRDVLFVFLCERPNLLVNKVNAGACAWKRKRLDNATKESE